MFSRSTEVRMVVMWGQYDWLDSRFPRVEKVGMI
jgi:hypothetical protein